MFRKVLVANRGEIAIRAFRAAYELGARTVAVFPYEDRNSLHRLKADEAYQIGEPGHPVRAYLSVEEIVKRGAARPAPTPSTRATASCRRTPSWPRLRGGGDHLRRPDRRGAGADREQGARGRRGPRGRRPGAGLLASRPADVDELVAAAEDIGFPVFVKAVAGGGGRGMRRVDGARRSCASPSRRRCARRSRRSATPRSSWSRRSSNPRHIEVQILADGDGNVIHLYERDCSVQRRHQKVIELAPGAQPRPGTAGPDLRRRGRLRPAHRLPQRRHRRVPARPARATTSSSR